MTTLLPLAVGAATLFYSGAGHRWARAHLGDSLAVALLVGVIGLVRPWRLRTRILLAAVIATAVELAQLSPAASERGGLGQLFLGTHFDPLDFLYYGLGLPLAALLHVIAGGPSRPT